MKVSPSLLACDLASIASEIESVSNSDYIHIDVMDGIFVPNISFGIPVIASARKRSDMVFDVHLMIDRPERYIKEFKKSGSDILTFHAESTESPLDVIKKIKAEGMKAGISIKPNTPVSVIEDCLPFADLVLVMTVEPGFGGQKIIKSCLEKATLLKKIREEKNYNYLIEADGGIDEGNLSEVSQSGVDIAVMGSAVYKIPKELRKTKIEEFKKL